MDAKKVKDFLKSDDGKELLKEIVAAETEGLVTKNEELLGELKKKKAELKDIGERLTTLETEKEEAETAAATKTGDVEKVRKQIEDKATKDKEALTAKLTAAETALNSVLIDKGLTEALVAAKVPAHFMKAVQAQIKAEYKSEVDSTSGSPVAKIDGKPLTEFVTSWSQGEQGKHFVAAEQNSGGGSNGAGGGSGAGSGKTIKQSEFDKLSGKEKQSKMADGFTISTD